jgi:WG containing repeat
VERTRNLLGGDLRKHCFSKNLISGLSRDHQDKEGGILRMRILVFLLLVGFFFASPINVAQARIAAEEPLFVVIVNDKRGFIDRTGKMVISPQFQGATEFSEGLAVVATNSNGYGEGYIDQSGTIVIPTKFDKATAFSEGLAMVGFDQDKREIQIGDKRYYTSSSHPGYKWGFIDKTGKYIAEPLYRRAGKFSEGLAPVEHPNGLWGFLNRSGGWAISPRFQWASGFSEGLACVRITGKFGFIDQTGKMVIAPQFTSPGSFSEGVAAVRSGGKVLNPNESIRFNSLGGRFVYIDKTGRKKIKLAGDIEQAGDFVDGLAPVELKGDWGFIDKTGKMVIEPRFGGQPVFSEGLAFVILKGGGIGFIDKTGAVVLRPEFALGENFSNGLAWMHDSLDYRIARYGYINKAGKIIWPPSK